MYNKINVQRHLEERECPNCGKIWSIYARGYNQKSRYRFCETCNPLFSNWEKKSIKYHKYPEEHEKFKKQKRKEDKEISFLQINGIGEAKIKKLLLYFGEFEKIKSASLEELKAVLNEVDSKNIFDYFKKEENG